MEYKPLLADNNRFLSQSQVIGILASVIDVYMSAPADTPPLFTLEQLKQSAQNKIVIDFDDKTEAADNIQQSALSLIQCANQAMVELGIDEVEIRRFIDFCIEEKPSLLELKNLWQDWVKQHQDFDFESTRKACINAIEKNDMDHAFTYIQQARNAWPLEGFTIDLLGFYYLKTQQVDKAIPLLEWYVEHYPNPQTINNLKAIKASRLKTGAVAHSELKKKKFSPGSHLGPWRLTQFIGLNNADEMWLCQKEGDNNDYFIKICQTTIPQIFAEFKKEVVLLNQLKDNPHFLPIIDAHVPETYDEKALPWFVLPKASNILEHPASLSDGKTMLNTVLPYLDVMLFLRNTGLRYTDIKPDHYMVYHDQPVLIDLGATRPIDPKQPPAETKLAHAFIKSLLTLMDRAKLNDESLTQKLNDGLKQSFSLETLKAYLQS